jgi:hypothetical protein
LQSVVFLPSYFSLLCLFLALFLNGKKVRRIGPQKAAATQSGVVCDGLW